MRRSEMRRRARLPAPVRRCYSSAHRAKFNWLSSCTGDADAYTRSSLRVSAWGHCLRPLRADALLLLGAVRYPNGLRRIRCRQREETDAGGIPRAVPQARARIRQSFAAARHRHAPAGGREARQARRAGHNRHEIPREREGGAGMALAVKPSWNPLRFTGTELPTQLLILVKVLALVVLLVNHVRILPDPWLPFIPGIDWLPPALFQRALQTAFVTSALALLFNRRVRVASLVLGSTMLLAVVSSKAYYGNNKTFCGLMFFLAGLYQPGGYNFIRWQLAITYFGAGLNKALDADWHSGVFFENWAVNRLQQPLYIAL